MAKTKLFIGGLIGALVLYAVYYYIKFWYFIQTYEYGYDIAKVDTKGFKLATFVSGSSFVEIVFNLWIINRSDYGVKISSLNVDCYYKSKYIGKFYKFDTINLAPHYKTDFPGTARIYVNRSMIDLALTLERKIIRVDYVATFKFNGLPFPFKYKSFYDLNINDYL